MVKDFNKIQNKLSLITLKIKLKSEIAKRNY